MPDWPIEMAIFVLLCIWFVVDVRLMFGAGTLVVFLCVAALLAAFIFYG